jgi:transcription termination/antitermination protein NusG
MSALRADEESSTVAITEVQPILSTPHSNVEDLFENPHWYAVYTCANREKQVAAQLASRGIEHFLPLYESVRHWTDRRVKVQVPLFPGYLFVCTALKRRLQIVTAPGVAYIVSSAGQPMPLVPEVIVDLRSAIERVAAQPYPYLPIGQRVHIRSGPLKGWGGILVRHKAGTRVVISIDLIERAFIADVDADDLVPDGPIIGLDNLQEQPSYSRTSGNPRPKWKDFSYPCACKPGARRS